MRWFRKKANNPLVDVVVYRTPDGNTLKCVESILGTVEQPFNLFFGPIEDFSNILQVQKHTRYHTPYLIIVPDNRTFNDAGLFKKLLDYFVNCNRYTIGTFDKDGNVHTSPAKSSDHNNGLIINRNEEGRETLEEFAQSEIYQKFSKPETETNSWVDIAIANVNPTNELLWQTILSIYTNTEFPFRIMVTCGLRSLSANRNMGLTNSTSDYVCLFDDDLLVNDPNWLSLLMETMHSAPDVAVVGPKVVGKSGKIVRCGADDLARPIGAGEPSSAYTSVFEVHTMSSCMLMKRKVVPLFDLLFPGAIAFEDIDHAYRLRRKGWRVMCDARVELTHLRPSTRNPIWTWNHLYYHLKYPRTLIGLGRIRGKYVE